ncbi:hypothetical protein KKF84_14435 [Myxococcota bacterium]|nr:hypothetical protein [Myxococcota bacterium]
MESQPHESLESLISIINSFRAKLPAKITDSVVRLNALILDPDKESRRELRGILEEMGYGTFTASSIAEAQNVLDSVRKLSVVVAVPRPDGGETITGVNFLSELKNKNPDMIPILSVSFAESEDAVGALRKNILGFFIKPYNRQEVISSLSELLYLHDKHNFVSSLLHHFLGRVEEWEAKYHK